MKREAVSKCDGNFSDSSENVLDFYLDLNGAWVLDCFASIFKASSAVINSQEMYS